MVPIGLAMVMSATLLAAGCAAGIGYTATVSNDGSGPDLVYAAPGVQVIADYDEPIFYTDSFYWRFYGGGWYRSSYYNRGWVYATPPVAVLRIDRPHAFIHYRPAGWVGHRDHMARQPMVREQRDDRTRPDPRRGEAPPRPSVQAPPLRGAPPPARVFAPAPNNRDRHDDGDHRDRRDHGDDHRDHRGHR
jgi:hypothetical protein